MAEKYYESDLTRMMRQLLQEKPHIVDEQKKSRAMWWDKKPDADAERRVAESCLRQPAYVYGSPISAPAKPPR
jgi:hypothetical protein